MTEHLTERQATALRKSEVKMKTEDYNKAGLHINGLFNQAGFTQQSFAKHINMDIAGLNRKLKGQTGMKREDLERICHGLGLSDKAARLVFKLYGYLY